MSDFTFENINWLLLTLTAPAVYFLYKIFYKNHGSFDKTIEDFADKNLLPHLVQNYKLLSSNKNKVLFWSLLWILACFVLAGPRWGYKEVETYSNNDSLIILLDLSNSMNATDVKPSRIARAKQEIEDILKLKDQDLKISLIGFSSVPHMITPPTFDTETIINLLPHIDTSLVNLEGSNLDAAIKMANQLLESNSYSKSILVMSDGGFDNYPKNIGSDISLSFMGFGTKNGAPIPNDKGSFLKKNGQIIIDKLQDGRMKDAASNGGKYIAASFLEGDSRLVLEIIKNKHENSKKAKNDKLIYWNEIFYIPLAFMMAAMLLVFRRGSFLLAFMFFIILNQPAQAGLFRNNQQEAKRAFYDKDYETAIEKFDDNYQKGVAQYKAGKYKEAEESFADIDNVAAKYNLGNSFFKQGKFDQAIKSYEEVLKSNPDDEDAKFNLELAKNMHKKQQQNQDNKQDDKDSDQSKDSNSSSKSDNSNNKDSDQKDSKEKDANSNNQKSGSKEDSKSRAAQKKEGGKESEEKESQKQEEDPDSKNKDRQEKAKQEKDGQDKEGEDKKDGQKNTKKSQQRQKLDFDADKQLNRIKSNPINILKNQFYIEEQKFLSKDRKKEEND